MISLANRGKVLGQMNPFINPALTALSPADTTPATANGASKVGVIGMSVLGGALALTSTLFTYGLAKESSSKMVRTTGYILAGVSALGTIAYLIGIPAAMAMAGPRR